MPNRGCPGPSGEGGWLGASLLGGLPAATSLWVSGNSCSAVGRAGVALLPARGSCFLSYFGRPAGAVTLATQEEMGGASWRPGGGSLTVQVGGSRFLRERGRFLRKGLSRFSHVRLCVTPWTAAHQAPPSLGFSRQEHWSGLPFPSPIEVVKIRQIEI